MHHLSLQATSRLSSPLVALPPSPKAYSLSSLILSDSRPFHSLARRTHCQKKAVVVVRAWRKKDTRNVAGRASSLILTLNNTNARSKEELFAVLDAWAAFQLDFPLLAVRHALSQMHRQKQWLRLLQVAKWMISRGHGKTFGTFELMMEALAELQRFDELEVMWHRVLTRHLDNVPRATFARLMSFYLRHNMPLKVLEVFGSADSLGIKLDRGMVHMVYAALDEVGAEEHKQEFALLYQGDVGVDVSAAKAEANMFKLCNLE